MNNLPKAKRDQLILVAVVTLMAMCGLFFFVGQAQRAQLKTGQERTESIRAKLTKADDLSRQEPDIQARLQKVEKDLADREATLAPERDSYAWLLQNLTQFLSVHRGAGVTAAGISQPDVGESKLIPMFPYKIATFHVKSTGYFHDVGQFIADLETQFPYVRIENLDLSRQTGTDAEKLAISFDLVMLMQPSTPIENR